MNECIVLLTIQLQFECKVVFVTMISTHTIISSLVEQSVSREFPNPSLILRRKWSLRTLQITETTIQNERKGQEKKIAWYIENLSHQA